MKKSLLHEVRAKRSFTLIELLVVIAIIAILASILMPALSSARERARLSTCTSNLKELGTALSNYSQDFEDFIVPSHPCFASASGQSGYGVNSWPTMLVYKKYLSSSNYSVPVKGLIVGTRKPAGVFRCPSITGEFQSKNTVSNAAGTSNYGMGYFVGTWSSNSETKIRARKINQYKFLSKVMYLGEKEWGPTTAYSISPYQDTNKAGNGYILDGMVRHNDRANYLFFDFHVETRQYTQVPAAHEGRLGLVGVMNETEMWRCAFWARLDRIKYWPGML